MAGVIMCDGRSPASCTMYSPRSVSTLVSPASSSAAPRSISSVAIDLLFTTVRAPCPGQARGRSRGRRPASRPGARVRPGPSAIARGDRASRRDRRASRGGWRPHAPSSRDARPRIRRRSGGGGRGCAAPLEDRVGDGGCRARPEITAWGRDAVARGHACVGRRGHREAPSPAERRSATWIGCGPRTDRLVASSLRRRPSRCIRHARSVLTR